MATLPVWQTIPVGLPDPDPDEPMTGAELLTVREWLAVTEEWMAHYLGVNGRTLRRWQDGASPIPDRVRLEVERLERNTATAVAALVTALENAGDVELVVYRTDAEYRAAAANTSWVGMTASWFRRAAVRAAHDVEGVVLRYPSSEGRP